MRDSKEGKGGWGGMSDSRGEHVQVKEVRWSHAWGCPGFPDCACLSHTIRWILSRPNCAHEVHSPRSLPLIIRFNMICEFVHLHVCNTCITLLNVEIPDGVDSVQ